MKGKIFTSDEANRMLPLVSRIADDIVAAYSHVNTVLGEFEAEKARAEVDESHLPILRERDEAVGAALDQFQALVEEIEALGGTVKDYEAGRIDFYGDVDGEIVYLCWQRGETSIGHWHSLEEGFSSRRLLPATTIAA